MKNFLKVKKISEQHLNKNMSDLLVSLLTRIPGLIYRIAQMFIFLHIPKTGGHSVKSILYRSFRDRGFLEINPSFDNSGPCDKEEIRYKELSEENMKSIRSFSQGFPDGIITGHLRFGVHEYIDHSSKYLTVLRNPLTLIPSLYHEMQRSPDPDDRTFVSGYKTLPDFAVETGDVQTLIVSGLPNMKALKRDPAQALELAKQNIRSFFLYVGLQENLKNFIQAITPLLNIENVKSIPRMNVSPERTSPDKALKKIILGNNTLDLELYAFAEKEFHSGKKKFRLW